MALGHYQSSEQIEEHLNKEWFVRSCDDEQPCVQKVLELAEQLASSRWYCRTYQLT